MTDLTLNTENATQVANSDVTLSNIERFLAGAKSLSKAFAKINSADQALFDQRLEVQQHKEAVSAALNGTGDFDAATRAFRAANNKLDKLLDANDSSLKSALAGIDALRRALDGLADDLRAAEV